MQARVSAVRQSIGGDALEHPPGCHAVVSQAEGDDRVEQDGRG
jgi:hypothetical protein